MGEHRKRRLWVRRQVSRGGGQPTVPEPGPAPEPPWNDPTLPLFGAPLLTTGQRRRTRECHDLR